MKQKGELGLTLAIASLVIMMIGTAVGVLKVNDPTSLFSKAISRGGDRGGCGFACESNANCHREDPQTGSMLQCDMRIHKCVSARAPGNPRCDTLGAPGGGTLGKCNEKCRSNEQCNATDPRVKDGRNSDPIKLWCNTVPDTPGYRTCQNQNPNAGPDAQCSSLLSPTSTPRPTGGGIGGPPTNPTVTPVCTNVGNACTAGVTTCCGTAVCRDGTGENSSGFSCLPPLPNEPTPSDSSCSGSQFSSRSYSCGVGFKVCQDPIIDKVTIRNRDGSGTLVIDASGPSADRTDGPTEGRRNPIGHQVWKTNPNDSSDNVVVRHGGTSADGSQARSGERSSDMIIEVFSGRANGFTQSDRFVYTFTQNLPDWWTSGSAYEVTLEYHIQNRIISVMPRRYTKSQATNSCRTTTPTPTVVTPTPTVITPTPTIVTPTPTEVTPTPTVVTPTPTVTPPPCNTDVHFLIDASTTVLEQFNNIRGDLSLEIKKYFDENQQDKGKLNISYQYFTWKNQPSKVLVGPNYEFGDYTGNRGTNIKQALEGGVKGTTIFISDGIPSLVDDYGTRDYACFFGADGCMSGQNTSECANSGNKNATNRSEATADGCVNKGNGSKFAMTRCPDDAKDTCKDITYQQVYDKTFSSARGQVKYGYLVDVDRYIQDIVYNSSENDSNNLAEIPSNLKTIIRDACGNVSKSGQPNRPQSIGYSMSLQNRSSSRTVQSLSFDLCDQASGTCDNRIIEQSTGPGQKLITNEVFSSVKNNPIRKGTEYNLNCTVNYQSGGSDSCGGAAIAGDGGLQYALTLDNEGVQGTPRTYKEASDNDNDGCVNVLDYARSLKNSVAGAQAGKSIQPYDIILDNKVNVQDLSVIINNLGECGK